jgi:hypothetical protein
MIAYTASGASKNGSVTTNHPKRRFFTAKEVPTTAARRPMMVATESI